MTANLVEKRILVTSDNRGLSEAIEFNMNTLLGVKVVNIAPGSLEEQENLVGNDNFDLIVVAMSSPASEPVMALARASLAVRIGQVPLLIISDRPSTSDPKARIFCLEFPFDADDLRDKVKEILRT